MKVEDAGVQNRILKEGLTIWINMDDKSGKTDGVRFPVGSNYAGGRSRPNMPKVTLNKDGSIVTPLSLANTIQLVGFANENPNRFPSDNADSFRGSVKYDNDGTLLYMLVIPIEKLAVRNSKDGSGAMPFAFGIEYGAPPEMRGPARAGAPGPESAAQGELSIQGGRSGGGRSGGGGSRGGGGQGGGGTAPRSFQNTTPAVLFWIKSIKLAAK
jgi:uncharacterized membrane protein YgcG